MAQAERRLLICGDLPPESLSLLAGQARVEIWNGACEAELAKAIGLYHGLVCGREMPVTREVIEAGRELRVIACMGQGARLVDIEAATRQGVVVVSSAGSPVSAAEYALGLLLGLARRVPQAHESLRNGRWERNRFVGIQVRRRTLGLIGLGQVGAALAKRARGFEMHVIACDPFVSPEYARNLSVELLGLDELLAASDFVSVHVPLTLQTAGLLGRRELAIMRQAAQLVNTSSSGVLDYRAAYEALEAGHLGGLATDSLPDDEETASLLVRHSRVIATPRLSVWTREAQRTAAMEVATDVLDVLNGRPAKLAINTPAIPREAFASLAPYVLLAEHLGRMLSQLSEGCWRQTEVVVQGELAQGDTAPLVSAAAFGILQKALPDRANLANALLLAKSRGMSLIERKDTSPPDRFASLIVLRSPAPCFVDEVAGTVVEGRPCVVRLGRYWVNIFPTGGQLFLSRSQDKPGIMGRVGTLLGREGITFSSLHLSRRGPEGEALMAMRLDSTVPTSLVPDLLQAAGAIDGRLLRF